jgi:hypothetical protein
MFVRFRVTKNIRETKTRLRVSLVETRRIGGKVRHLHIVSLGSVPMPPEVDDRLAFWQRLHGRLADLANRLDGEKQAKVLGEVHARIPMAVSDERGF